jgi:putative nucleotidyltransferase with HDIG domain
MQRSKSLLVICDNDAEGDALASLISSVAPFTRQDAGPAPTRPMDELRGVIVDLGDQSAARIARFGHNLTLPAYCDIPRLFILRHPSERVKAQAAELGATDIAIRPLHGIKIDSFIKRLVAPSNVVEMDSRDPLQSGVAAAHNVMCRIFEDIPRGRPLTFNDVVAAERTIATAVRETHLASWLNAVDNHHNHTYRHCLYVTGIAIAFAQHLAMREEDQCRITRAALLHDVGKALIPLAILDKPGRLDDDERAIMRTHPQLGYDCLLDQNQFPADTLDAVLSHHEFLDGSGYPRRLAAAEISDLVRITTIADIYSALTEDRSYQAERSPREAYEIMVDMGAKLDQHLLKAFRPVVEGLHRRCSGRQRAG